MTNPTPTDQQIDEMVAEDPAIEGGQWDGPWSTEDLRAAFRAGWEARGKEQG